MVASVAGRIRPADVGRVGLTVVLAPFWFVGLVAGFVWFVVLVLVSALVEGFNVGREWGS